MGERLAGANLADMARAIEGREPEGLLERLRGRLGAWGGVRAEAMARFEAAKAHNDARIEGFRSAGYAAVWVAPSGECPACKALDGKAVTTLRPPLHKGCACQVAMGERIGRELTNEEMRDRMRGFLDENGIYAHEVSVPAKVIDGTEGYAFDVAHVDVRRAVTEEDARRYIREARMSLTRKYYTGEWFECYFSPEGASYVSPSYGMIKTAYPKADFDDNIARMVEEVISLDV